MLSIVLAALAGGALAYFWDPDRGRSRRTEARDRVSSAGHRVGDRVGGLVHRPGGSGQSASGEAAVADVDGATTGVSNPAPAATETTGNSGY